MSEAKPMSKINIVLDKDFNVDELRNSVFITGYTGFGLVGYLASRHIAYTLSMERIGFIETKYMPETTFYTNTYGIVYPFELFYKRLRGDLKILVLINHTIPSTRERTLYVKKVCRWVKEVGVSQAILIGGLDPAIREDPNEKYRWIPIGGYTGKLSAPILEEKYVVGPLALTIMYLDAYRVPGVVMLSYAEPYRPDPRATAVIVTEISKMLGISIDVSDLYEEAKTIERIEDRMTELLERIQESGEKREHPMYM